MTFNFSVFRKNIIGINQTFSTPFGEQKLLYADWTASGRLYGPIEDRMIKDVYPFVANTHTETNITGSSMTSAYHEAFKIIKEHVNANENDVIIASNSGMTGVINKFQRILGLKVHETHKKYINISENERPVVFITHMEHHSNHTSWIETIADVVIIEPDEQGLVNLKHFEKLLKEYEFRKFKIASVTACSNVTGIFTPYYKIAELIHEAGGLCFVDFACSAPYVNVNMHPDNPKQYLDAIFFSPHKFLGGPGTSGVLLFNKDLYRNYVPDTPGGGTVDWTNPWGQHKYIDDIEAREDGGTPAFLQTIKVALCVKLKEEIGVKNMLTREKVLLKLFWDEISNIKNLHILAGNIKDRLAIISFYIDDLHYNLGVKILNDRYGIQVRGGCSCAGTYGHYLLHVNEAYSKEITDLIDRGDYSKKPGWIRVSLHPTMTDDEVIFIASAIKELASNHKSWSKDYLTNFSCNEIKYCQKGKESFNEFKISDWYERPLTGSANEN